MKCTRGYATALTMLLGVMSSFYVQAVIGPESDPNDVYWDDQFTLRGTNGTVHSVANGRSGNVYIGGDFDVAGNIAANSIAKWNASTSAWSALGSGMNGWVRALAVDGLGNVYAGGSFTTAGGVTVNRVAKWNGTTWSALGTGVDSSVEALAVDGDNVYAGGTFTLAGGVTVNGVAKWNGTAWSPLGSGTGGGVPYVYALAVDG